MPMHDPHETAAVSNSSYRDMDEQPTAATIRLILDAASFAATKHRTQRRKDHEASPYINHPPEQGQGHCSA